MASRHITSRSNYAGDPWDLAGVPADDWVVFPA
jgi:hypothetical protein